MVLCKLSPQEVEFLVPVPNFSALTCNAYHAAKFQDGFHRIADGTLLVIDLISNLTFRFILVPSLYYLPSETSPVLAVQF